MLFTTHPDMMLQLANERIQRLRAEAASYRRARPPLARWRPARFVEPAADRHRVAPIPTPAKTDRAA